MRLNPPRKEDDGTVDTGNQDGDIPGYGGSSPELSEERIAQDEVQQHGRLGFQEQFDGSMDHGLRTSNSMDWMGSRMESISPFARLLEEESNFPPCCPGSPYFLPRILMERDYPPLSIQIHPDETTGKLEGLLSILDMALAIVNGN
jgi:hypothetical protein